MRIELASLEGGKGDFDYVYEPDELNLDDDRMRLAGIPRVSGRIEQKGRRVEVEGRLVTQVEVECDRCLKPVELPVDARFEREFMTAQDYEEQQAVELTEDDLDLSVYDGEAIDIDELVKEELMLAVPAQVLCREACQGICAVCGEDKNLVNCGCATEEIDPRWSALKGLVNGK
jgi:uncharacterized protein